MVWCGVMCCDEEEDREVGEKRGCDAGVEKFRTPLRMWEQRKGTTPMRTPYGVKKLPRLPRVATLTRIGPPPPAHTLWWWCGVGVVVCGVM